jgi:hypothetical protein
MLTNPILVGPVPWLGSAAAAAGGVVRAAGRCCAATGAATTISPTTSPVRERKTAAIMLDSNR